MNSPAMTGSGLSSIKIEALLVTILLAIVCVISWPGMSSRPIIDDIDQMSHVLRFKSWKDCLGPDSYNLFRPFKNFIFYYLKDASPFKGHVVTLGAYLGAVVALYALFRRIIGPPTWAFAGALLWASCPTQVSTVVWMSAVNLSIAMAFSCGCIIFHDLSQARQGRNAMLTVLACLFLFLAQVSYETAVAVPALCILTDFLRKRPVFSRTSIMRYCALALVTVGFLIMRSLFGATHSGQNANFGFAPGTQAWQLSVSAPWFLWKHLTMWLMPVGRMEFCSGYIWGKSASIGELVGAWVWLLSLGGVILVTWKRLPMIAIGLLWFLAASFPPSNFIPIWSGPIEDYYLVFPSVGLVIAGLGCAKVFARWAKLDPTVEFQHLRLIGGCLLVICSMWRILCIPVFWLQADLWNRPAELYLRLEASRSFQFQLQAAAARELMLMGKLEEAKVLARQSYEAGPWYPLSSMILGYIELQEGNYANAEKKLRESMEKSSPGVPIHDYSRLHLAKALEKQDAGTSTVRETLLPLLNNQHGAYHLDAIRMLIEFYMSHNQPNDALRATRNAIKLHPDDPQFTQILTKIQKSHPETSTNP